ncbi:MAG: hypothetical protein KIT84_07105 [Labilithrix sp.]|nr:hypothetical protein [Labilithrix sp.]MCW5810762.1 hypothetical protein [Labilithrix sp.]
MRPTLLFFVLAGVPLALALPARDARACSLAQCRSAVATGLGGRTIPSGVRQIPAMGKDDEPAQLFLGSTRVTATGRNVGDGSEGVLETEAPLAPGEYLLRTQTDCSLVMDGTWSEVRFTVGTAAFTAPAKLGTLSVTKQLRAPDHGGDTCGDNYSVETVAVTISLDLDPALDAVLPLVRLEETLTHASGHKEVEALRAGDVVAEQVPIRSFRVPCNAKGRFRFDVGGAVVGTDVTLPSESLEVDVDCESLRPTATPPPATTTTPDAKTTPTTSEEDAGCSTTRARTDGGLPLLALGALALLGAHRRSRRAEA